jgi:hypothetical protein
MQRFWFPLFVLAVGCGNATGETHNDSPAVPPQAASSAPLVVAQTIPAPSLPPLALPRLVAAADVRVPKSTNKKDPRKDIRVQVFFPNDVPKPVAGETADIIGPDGYRFTARVSYVKEEVRFAEEGKPFQVSSVGYYAVFQPIYLPDGVEISQKGELDIVAIPSVEERRSRLQPIPTAPDDSQRPEALKGAKLTSYADADADGKVDVIAATVSPDSCRLVFVKERDGWQEKRRVCGAFPQQIRISTAPPKPEDLDATDTTGTTTDPKKPTTPVTPDPKKPTTPTPSPDPKKPTTAPSSKPKP